MGKGILASIQGECAAELSAAPYFSAPDVPVLTQSHHDLGSLIQIALRRQGVYALVTVPSADVEYPDQEGPYFERIEIAVIVVEAVRVNQAPSGTGKSALEVCENVAATLHHFAPGGLSEVLNCDKPTIKLGLDNNLLPDMDPADIRNDHVIYTVRFKVEGQLKLAKAVLDAPVITPVIGSVTIAPATSGGNPVAGAAVYYTLNGSAPSPQNGTAYSGPITVTMPTVVRARAWMYGYLPGPIAQTNAYGH
jgi:hypothetical protein